MKKVIAVFLCVIMLSMTVLTGCNLGGWGTRTDADMSKDTSTDTDKSKDTITIIEGEETDGDDNTADSGEDSTPNEDVKPTEGIVYEMSEDSTYAIVVDYTGLDADVIIAAKYNGVPVKSIASNAFHPKNKDVVATVLIPESVTVIANNAFHGCKSLTSIKIPDSVTILGDFAFYGCDSLTNVTIGNSVTSIGYSAFSNCVALTSVTIGNSITRIGDLAFSWCISLTDVTLGSDVTDIGYGAFAYCSSLTSVTIPNSVTNIGDYVFYNSKALAIINYRGSEAQWSDIFKSSYWDSETGSYTIIYNYASE